ncbi:MAG TPA: class I SAM-dependent methyltransferase [Bacteroidota bacterium]|nr:class I SAM-dependent methyltransferase [Bacteroidota bacterium]
MPLDDLYTASKGYYDRNASRYEAASWYYFNGYKTAAVRKEINKCLALLSGKREIRVLEIGPGTGYLLRFLLERAGAQINYTGIEHSEAMREILSARYASLCRSFTLMSESVTPALIEGMPDSARFDLVLGSSILHHLPDYEGVVRALAHRVLPGGVLYMVREPIHRNECATPSFLAACLERLFSVSNELLMSNPVRRRLWPGKVKAEDASAIILHMMKDGVSTSVFTELKAIGFCLVSLRKYNRRVSTLLSFAENAWLRRLRKDIYGNTLLAVCMRRAA